MVLWKGTKVKKFSLESYAQSKTLLLWKMSNVNRRGGGSTAPIHLSLQFNKTDLPHAHFSLVMQQKEIFKANPSITVFQPSIRMHL